MRSVDTADLHCALGSPPFGRKQGMIRVNFSKHEKQKLVVGSVLFLTARYFSGQPRLAGFCCFGGGGTSEGLGRRFSQHIEEKQGCQC